MSEMIERVAKAMCERSGTDWTDASDDPYSPPLINRPFWRLNARCAIEAMREPTEEQYDALSNLGKMWKEINSTIAWQTYIDGALEGK